MKKELKEKFMNLTKDHYSYTLVNANTNKAQIIKEKYANIRYSNIFQAYANPSTAKITSSEKCKQMIEDLAKDVKGIVDYQGIQGAGKDNYNWLGRITSPTNKMRIYVYCTKCNNFITIEELT